jgi:D-methionine transport system substrate-binding protein
MMKKQFKLTILMVLTVLILAACGGLESSSHSKLVKIGVTGADGVYWDLIIEKAKAKGIEIELVEFSDYVLPNNALANGEIDMNSFQHLAFLSQFNVEHNLNNVPIGSTVIAPMGLYSEKYKDLSEIPNDSKIAIPNDPVNTGRALKVIAATGLLELKEDVGLYATPGDIVSNPKNIEIVPVVAQQTPRVLADVAASVINNGIAGQAGLDLEDALFYDDPNSEEARPYLNVFAVKAEDQDNETYRTIAKIYQEPDVVEAVIEDSKGGNLVIDVSVNNLQATLDQLTKDIKSGK